MTMYIADFRRRLRTLTYRPLFRQTGKIIGAKIGKGTKRLSAGFI